MNLYDEAWLYDLQYDSYRDDVPHYLRLADSEGSPVLELGSGSGRLTEALVRAGHQVTGIELSEAMLQRARERLGTDERADLRLGDIRSPGVTPGSFRLVLAPFNVLMHLYTIPEQDTALDAAYAALEPGGMIALDLYVPRFGPEGVLRSVPEWRELRGRLLLLQEHDRLAQLVTSHYYLDEDAGDGLLRRRVITLQQRWYHRFEIERALLAAGFSDVRLRGGFGGERFDEHSPLMVITARRPA